jgi:hypothetical protein
MISVSLMKPTPDETMLEFYPVPNRATTAATINAFPIGLGVSFSGSGPLSPNDRDHATSKPLAASHLKPSRTTSHPAELA